MCCGLHCNTLVTYSFVTYVAININTRGGIYFHYKPII